MGTLHQPSLSGPAMELIIQELRTFVVDNFLFGDVSGRFTFTNDDSLQECGIVDSTGILELICHLQERYRIEIDDAELVPENLDSVTRVACFVERKQREQSTASQRPTPPREASAA
jgi:acyl carrier protein